VAQQHQQLWLDYQFANQYLFEVTTSYQTVFTDSAKWIKQAHTIPSSLILMLVLGFISRKTNELIQD